MFGLLNLLLRSQAKRGLDALGITHADTATIPASIPDISTGGIVPDNNTENIGNIGTTQMQGFEPQATPQPTEAAPNYLGMLQQYFQPQKESKWDSILKRIQEVSALGHTIAGDNNALNQVVNRKQTQPAINPLQILQLQEQARHNLATEKMARQKSLEVKEPKTNQFQAAGYGKRLEQANKIFDNLDKLGSSGTGLKESLERSKYFPEILKGEGIKSRQQAERNFVNALLRRESGAAIAESEFTSAEKQYFPRVGDTNEILKQKKANRLQALANLKAESSRAWDLIPSISTQNNIKEINGKRYKKVKGGWEEI